MAHWGQNMIVHRFAKHYPAVFAVSKAISITLAGSSLFSQMPRFSARMQCDRPTLHFRPFFLAHNFLDSIEFV